MSGAILLGIITLVCIVDVLIGLRIARSGAVRPAPGMPPEYDKTTAEQRRRSGRMMMLAAAVLWLIVAAICFGIIPSHGITLIKF